MQIEPSESAFAERYRRDEAQVVWTTLGRRPGDARLGFFEAWRRQGDELSARVGRRRGRPRTLFYHRTGARSDLANSRRKAEINRTARAARTHSLPAPTPLQALRALIAESRIALPDRLAADGGGVFGYLGYDMVRLMEELAAPNPDPIGIPDAILVRPTIIVVFDAVKNYDYGRDAGAPGEKRRRQSGARARRRAARACGRQPRPAARQVAAPSRRRPHRLRRLNRTRRRDEFKAMVRKAKEYIAAGDIFQVVLAQRFEAPFTLPPFSLYRALRRTNPSPYLYFLDFGDFAVAGSSPEILVKVSRRHCHDPPDRRHPSARRDAARGQGAGGRTARRPERTRRASDAARSWPQRCRPRRRVRHA